MTGRVLEDVIYKIIDRYKKEFGKRNLESSKYEKEIWKVEFGIFEVTWKLLVGNISEHSKLRESGIRNLDI